VAGLLQEVRFALRQLRKDPGYLITATSILAVLAAIGIYGVVAHRSQLRKHEIGIRVALGASRVDVLRLVLLQGMSLTAIGLILGLVAAFVLTRFIGGLLYGVGANDPVTVLGVVVLLGAMSLLACYLPAQRAMRANPVAAIREL
jgi:ABC-type antimicrobial peptide transport system permease subunit